MNYKMISIIEDEKEKINDLDFKKSSDHYLLLKHLTTLILAIEAVYEVVPNHDKIGSFETIQTFAKYFEDKDSEKRFAKGLQNAKELKGNFKKLVVLVTGYLKERNELKENKFEWSTHHLHFGTVLKNIKEFLYKFLEANPIKADNNILSKATDIVKNIKKTNKKNIESKVEKLERLKNSFHENVNILNNLEEVQFEDELDDEESDNDEYIDPDLIDASFIDGTILGVVSNNYNNIVPRCLPDFKMEKDKIYKIGLSKVVEIMFQNAMYNFDNDDDHANVNNLFDRLSLKPSFKENSKTAKFMKALLDVISQMMKALAFEADEENGEIPMPLAIFKLGLIYDLIAMHLGFSIKQNKKE